MLSSLRLQNFRCFESLTIEASEAGMIFTGENAQGKTSILEAICTLVRLQSPRTNRFNALNRFGSSGFGVAGDPWQQERKIQQTSARGLRMKVDDEERQSRTEYLADGGLIVWMGNEDLSLVRGPGEGRRGFLDFLGMQMDPRYRTALTRYRRALKAKNLLLKEPNLRLPELIAYEEILIEHGTFLLQSRASLIAELAPLVAAAQKNISGKSEALTLAYLPASGENLKDSILQARKREISSHQAVVGPHRDDLSIRLQGMPANEYASEGQQRTIAIALKLAQGDLLNQRHARTPIYLLDDVFGELDPPRRNALLQHLPKHSQKFITTTHLGWRSETGGAAELPVAEVREKDVFNL